MLKSRVSRVIVSRVSQFIVGWGDILDLREVNWGVVGVEDNIGDGVRGREHWNLGGEVKFSNVDLHLPGDHEVGQGKISVHDLVTVEILHPRDDLIKDVSGLRFREGMFGILDTLPV